MKEANYQKMSMVYALGAGISALAYAYFFVIASDPLLYSISLALFGLFSLKTFIYLYGRLKNVHEGVARLALVLTVAGSLGALIHGGYDLANVLNPTSEAITNLPNQVDPRGLLTFGLAGLGLAKVSYLIGKDKSFPKGLDVLGYLSGALLVLIYLGRLIILDPTNPMLLYPVLLNGFILGPLWFLWLGWSLNKK